MSDTSPHPQRRGGRGGRETAAVLAEREARVWDLSCRGLRQRAIAERVGISQAAVCKILQRVRRRVHAQMATTYARVSAQHIDRLEALLAAAFDAWDASRIDRTRRRQRRLEGGSAGETSDRLTAEIDVENRAGDARLLREAREIVALLITLVPPVPPDTGRTGQTVADRLRTLSDAEFATLKQPRLQDRIVAAQHQPHQHLREKCASHRSKMLAGGRIRCW